MSISHVIRFVHREGILDLMVFAEFASSFSGFVNGRVAVEITHCAHHQGKRNLMVCANIGLKLCCSREYACLKRSHLHCMNLKRMLNMKFQTSTGLNLFWIRKCAMCV